MNSAVPHVDHISEASLLRKSSCNYLRTGISCKNLLALIVADGVRLFKYSQTSGSITDTFCTIKIGVGNLIRDLAWAPLGWQRETLALCFDDRVELWSRLSAANTFTREATYKLGNIAGILQIIWDERIFNDILVCSSTIIHKIQLLSSSEAPTQVLPSLNTRHPGGVALSSADTLITGNKYREAVAALGFVGGTSSEQPHGRRRLLVERCRSEEGEEEGSYRHSCSLSHVDCGGLCFLSFEPEASLMSSTVTSTPFTTLPSTPSLISVVTSTPAMSAVEEDDEDSLTDMGVLSLQSHNPKPRGSFPHSAHGASISDTLSIHSIGQQSGNGHGELAHVTSALEALQSVSNCLHVGSSTDMTSKGNPGHGKSDVSLMATSGMICAVRTSNDGKELRWLGSSLSLSRSPAERSDTGSTSLLRPDVMAMCPLTSVRPLPLSGESTLSCCFLAVSSTQTGQIILYEVTEVNSQPLLLVLVLVFYTDMCCPGEIHSAFSPSGHFHSSEGGLCNQCNVFCLAS